MKETYFITYDLIETKDYKKLTDELERYGAKRILLSVWCLKKAETTAGNLRDHFAKFIDNDDKILVIKSDGWASRGKLLFDPNKL